MSPLRVVQPRSDHRRVTVEELLSLLGPEHLDAIEQQARIMRETFTCPAVVPDYNTFKKTLCEFFAHYQLAFFNADLKHAAQNHPGRISVWKQMAYTFCEQHLEGYKGDFRTAERNSITGREGGMIGVIDALTDGIAKFHTETYCHTVFFDHIPPGDFDLRLRLVEQVLAKFGPVLFPGEILQHPAILAANFERFFQSFVSRIHSLRRDWRD